MSKNLSKANNLSLEHNVPVEIADAIFRAVRELNYGSVEIVVHDTKVVQIEKREKIRLQPAV